MTTNNEITASEDTDRAGVDADSEIHTETTTDNTTGNELAQEGDQNTAALEMDADFEPQALNEELIAEIRSRRPMFDARGDYNAMVCDELLRCGEIPTQKNVLTVGKWGSAKDVSRDVSTWRQSFTKRLQPGPLPFAAQRLANQMLAQLMDLCRKTAAEPMEAAVTALQSQLDQVQAAREQERQELQQALAQATERATQLTEELAQTTTLLQRQSDEMGRCQERITALESSVVTLNVEKRQIESSARETISRLESAYDRERTSINEANARLVEQIKDENRAAIAELKARITSLDAAVDGANRQAAVQIEVARSDAKKWQEHARAATEQIDKARAAEIEAREKLASETLRVARFENQVGRLQRELEACQAKKTE